MINKSKAADSFSASVESKAAPNECLRAGGVFHVQCFDKDGNLKWEEKSHNLVVNVGLQDMNTKYFTGSGYTASWFIGLVNASPTPTYAGADTMASHAGWSEFAAYTISGNNTIRATCTFGTATTADPSVISNSGSPAAFTITGGSATIAGAFLASNNSKSGSTGILFSESNFTGGNRPVTGGDTVNVTYTFSLDAL